MNHPYMKPIMAAYVIIMLLLTIFTPQHEVHAISKDTKQAKVVVYELEMNSANYDTIKKDILNKQEKYILNPERLPLDLDLSEVVLSNADVTSFKPQMVKAIVNVYTSSKTGKQIVEQIEEQIHVHFVDNQAPTITLKDDSIKFVEGTHFDASSYVDKVTDNSFTPIDLKIDHLVNQNIPGEYEVTYTAIDASNNQTSKTMSVTVTKKPVVVKQVSRPYYAQSYVSSEVSGDRIYSTLNIINQERASRGLAPLSLAPALEQQAAGTRAAEAARYLSHTRPDGRHYKTAFTDLGVSHRNPIEVLTYAGGTPSSSVAWWMSSSGHRAAIMNPYATTIALGISGSMYAGIVY